MSQVYDLLIIGGGPAGLSAAIYASRSNLSTAVLEKAAVPGGQVNTTSELENYPGFFDTSGPEIMEQFTNHSKKFGTEFHTGEVTDAQLEGNIKSIKTDKETIKAKAVMVATGAEPSKLGVKGEAEFVGKGVSYCGTCDAAFFEELEVAVIGGGDTAVEEALYLTRFADKVTIIHRREKLRASRALRERAMENEKISFIWNSVIEEITGDELVTGLNLKNVVTNEKSHFEADGVFIFVGTKPNTEFLHGKIDLTDRGYVIVNDLMETSCPGVYSVGDVNDKYLRQVVTAAADGAIGATACEKYLESINVFEENVINPSHEKPVIVIYWDPSEEESTKIRKELEDNVDENKMRLVNIDSTESQILKANKVETIPTVAVYKKGELVTSYNGSSIDVQKIINE
ncbi:thioredoxin-disulfide reductase [Natranaerobius trueperi]|uniref:Thioredoxin reductase n=1 Tax=Natranaerobius trueperi TaxID=759412 RepID=A0A226C0D8_9FIRM|nr:thioredoxin-disulfide reductase [Natranaerobius trueperi]OWZ84723.1 thioredoxin-disulfide reductase [Natranaerobius trueperi]